MKKSNPILIGTFLVVLICLLIFMQSQSGVPDSSAMSSGDGHDHGAPGDDHSKSATNTPKPTEAPKAPSVEELKGRLKSNVPKASPTQIAQPDSSGTDPNSSVIPRGRWWETQKK